MQQKHGQMNLGTSCEPYHLDLVLTYQSQCQYHLDLIRMLIRLKNAVLVHSFLTETGPVQINHLKENVTHHYLMLIQIHMTLLVQQLYEVI